MSLPEFGDNTGWPESLVCSDDPIFRKIQTWIIPMALLHKTDAKPLSRRQILRWESHCWFPMPELYKTETVSVCRALPCFCYRAPFDTPIAKVQEVSRVIKRLRIGKPLQLVGAMGFCTIDDGTRDTSETPVWLPFTGSGVDKILPKGMYRINMKLVRERLDVNMIVYKLSMEVKVQR